MLQPPDEPLREWIALGSDALPAAGALEWVTMQTTGASVCFAGTVRDHAAGRDGVVGLDYEAYEQPAIRALGDVAAQARSRWAMLGRIALLHRVGHLVLGDVAVVAAVSSPHRAEAFDAAEFCIDTLKAAVPIWKKEHWAGGEAWGLGAQPLVAVESTSPGGVSPRSFGRAGTSR